MSSEQNNYPWCEVSAWWRVDFSRWILWILHPATTKGHAPAHWRKLRTLTTVFVHFKSCKNSILMEKEEITIIWAVSKGPQTSFCAQALKKHCPSGSPEIKNIHEHFCSALRKRAHWPWKEVPFNYTITHPRQHRSTENTGNVNAIDPRSRGKHELSDGETQLIQIWAGALVWRDVLVESTGAHVALSTPPSHSVQFKGMCVVLFALKHKLKPELDKPEYNEAAQDALKQYFVFWRRLNWNPTSPLSTVL